MAASTDDVIYSPDTTVELILGTSTRAADVFSTSGEQTNELSSNEHLLGNFTLTCAFSVAPTSGGIDLFMRPLNRDSTNDSPEPSASFEHTYLGTFPVDDVTTTQYLALDNIEIPYGDFSFYIRNGTNQTLSTSYVLDLIAITYNLQA